MKLIQPSLDTTEYSPELHEWVPASFDSLIREMEYAYTHLEGTDPLPLYRGQTNYLWPLDCTFVRKSIEIIFQLPDYQDLNRAIRRSLQFHKSIASLIHLKFGLIGNPSKELWSREKQDDTDPWFEYLKNIQQYPENDRFIPGTFLLDWTLSRDIALYFSVYDGKGDNRIISKETGAVWLYDAVSTGKTWQTKKLEFIIERMKSPEFFDGVHTLPLMIHPQTQTNMPRATNQQTVYISQMDYRCDLADTWYGYENEHQKRVFLKFIIKEEIKPAITEYLESKGIFEDIVFPE